MRGSQQILAIDIGGTGLKAAVIDEQGHLVGERLRVATPYPCPPDTMIDALKTLCRGLQGFRRIAIGFPGVVRRGQIVTAPHFDDIRWQGFPLAAALSEALGGHPARLVNDAEMQGLAAIRGEGLELVLTLGTGAGTALFRDGDLMPHMELAHHPIRDRKSYNDYVGDPARKKIGHKKWNKRVLRTIGILESLLHFDHLYIGGGNAAKLDNTLPLNVSTVSNDAGLAGGAALWRLNDAAVKTDGPTAAAGTRRPRRTANTPKSKEAK